MSDSRGHEERRRAQRKNKFLLAVAIAAAVALLVFLAVVLIKPPVGADTPAVPDKNPPEETVAPEDDSGQVPDEAEKEPEHTPVALTKGYLAATGSEVEVFTAEGNPAGSLPRGTEIEYSADEPGQDGVITFTFGGLERSVPEDAVEDDITRVVREQTLYVRTAVNMSDENGVSLGRFLEKGSAVRVTGYEGLQSDGTVLRYRAEQEGESGYVAPKYLAADSAAAEAVYDGFGMYSKHADREDMYGGGEAGNLDYYPRPKQKIEGNDMPDEVKALYLANSWVILDEVDSYIAYADTCGINAFVVDIIDGGMVGYPSPVMEQYSPTTAEYANNPIEDYALAIKKLKDAGYYVIGRLTTFNDPYFVRDHPECAIKGLDGEPMEINGMYWPTAYDRYAWEYKTSLAVEAVKEFGFNEIQFDYVRFPDLTWQYERDGTIDYVNVYGETKAQAIQRFLMYACDRVHEAGAYVGIDVFGECAFGYVTAYGQYWPALSEVVDVISGMPYPDHFPESDGWRPWEHPYETVYNWGLQAAARQDETENPAAVRTWIQTYDAIRYPYNPYGPDEVGAEIRGLHDAGLYGGFMTWHFSSSLEKYRMLAPAFDL